jgi:hypothetical protein
MRWMQQDLSLRRERLETLRDVAKEVAETADAPGLETSGDVSGRTKPKPSLDPDEALRMAVKAALDAGDLARVRALVDILEGSPAPAAAVVSLTDRRGAAR